MEQFTLMTPPYKSVVNARLEVQNYKRKPHQKVIKYSLTRNDKDGKRANMKGNEVIEWATNS